MAQKNYTAMQQAIANATHTEEAQEERKPRKTYTPEEAAEIMKTLKTSGHKGVKLPRINLAFHPDVYEYIQIMSRVRGESMTEFVNVALHQHMFEHREIYDKAIEFRNSL